MSLNNENQTDEKAIVTDRQGSPKGGGGGAFAIILIILIIGGLLYYFTVSKPTGPQLGKAMEILPDESAFVIQADINALEDPKAKDKLWEKLKENPKFKEQLEKIQKEENINIEEDVISWLGGQFTIASLTFPKGQSSSNEPFVIVLTVKDLEKAKASLAKLSTNGKVKFTEEKYDTVSIMVPDKKDSPSYAFLKGMLVLGNRPEDVKKCIDVSNKKVKNLHESERFKKVMAKLKTPAVVLMYMDMEKAMAAAKEEMPRDENMEKAIKAMQGMGFCVTQKDGNFIGAGYVMLDKTSESPLIKAMLEAKPTMGNPESLKMFPADTSYFAAIDAKLTYDIIMKIVESQQGGKEQMQTALDQIKQQMGVDVNADVIGNLEGELAYSLDFMGLIKQSMGMEAGREASQENDLKNIGTALEMYSTDNDGKYPVKLEELTPKYLSIMPKPPEGLEFYYKSKKNPDAYMIGYKEKGKATMSFKHPRYDSTTGLHSIPKSARENQKVPPMVFALRFKDKEKLKKTYDTLMGKLGMMFGKEEKAGFTLYTFPEKAGGMTLYENFLLVGIGLGTETITTILENKKDEAKSLASTEGYKMIKDKLGADTISVGMVKLEKMLPLMNMAITMSASQQGPEKAQAAKVLMEVINKYNEMWSYSSLKLDGVEFHFIVLKTKEAKEADKK